MLAYGVKYDVCSEGRAHSRMNKDCTCNMRLQLQRLAYVGSTRAS